MTDRQLFNTVFGRGLIGELRHYVHEPTLVVTMADLWPKFEGELPGAHVLLVSSLEQAELERTIADLPDFSGIVGLGGGQALDVAKYVAWRRRQPLFQVPTSMSVNAAFAHRSAIRVNGVVRYVGWAVPEAVYVDYKVIADAPKLLNHSGVGDIFCYHTAHWDWRLAADTGNEEPQWPYDEGLVAEAGSILASVMANLDEIHAVSHEGIRTLMEALRWGGSAFHNLGWNPRPIEGSEHHFFYALESITRQPYLHGQVVGLGLLLMSSLQENEPEKMRKALDRVGVSYRPGDMSTSWDQVEEALRILPKFSEQNGLWYTVARSRPITPGFIADMRNWLSD